MRLTVALVLLCCYHRLPLLPCYCYPITLQQCFYTEASVLLPWLRCPSHNPSSCRTWDLSHVLHWSVDRRRLPTRSWFSIAGNQARTIVGVPDFQPHHTPGKTVHATTYMARWYTVSACHIYPSACQEYCSSVLGWEMTGG